MNFIIRTIAQRKVLFAMLLFGGISFVIVYKNAGTDNVRNEAPEPTSEIFNGVKESLNSISSRGNGEYSSIQTNWGFSPFDRPSIGMQPPTLEFKPPNTEWQARTISGVTYVFGEGDPKEVAVRREDYQSDDDFMHQEVVSARFERNLKKLLSDPSLVKIINKCGSLLYSRPEDQSTIARDFPDSIYKASFDMESMIYIDPNTRRKALNQDRYSALAILLSEIGSNSDQESPPLADKCLSNSEIDELYKLRQYFDLVDLTLQNNPDSFYDNAGISGLIN